jgi:hypothetical protein
MKIPLIAPFAVVSLFFAACGQKSAQITSSSSPPSPAPTEAAESPDYSGVSSSSSAEASSTAEVANSPSANGTSNPGPVFRSEAATQAANQYLNSYNALRNDANGPAPKLPPGNLEGSMSALRSYAQKLAQQSAEFENQRRQVDSQLTPDEKKRLLQYQGSLEQGGKDQ